MVREYITQHSRYPVDRLTANDREVIIKNEKPYVIVGFADLEKLGQLFMGADRYWYLKSTNQTLTRRVGENRLEDYLEKEPKPGLHIVGWLVDGAGNYVENGNERELVSSKIKEIRD